MRICIKTLGCKANRYESDKLFEILKEDHDVFELNKEADILIVNTCTVTHVADRKSRRAIRSYKKANPNSKVIVFGCGANVSKEDYEKIEEVDFVVQSTEEVFQLMEKIGKKEKNFNTCDYENSMTGSRTRALVKIQDGCENFCSYCIVPFARGPAVSFKSKKILEEVLQKEKAGYKEIVITGINIGEWKEDGTEISDLFEMLIENTERVRFRVSSIEPKNFSDKFFELFKTGRFCPHIHMSLQSGSDSVLKRMRRNYDTRFFLEVCEKFRKAVPDTGLTTDVIVGFPGETDEEFEETCEFIKKIGFLKVHVFPYSKRKNTAAYYMKDHVSEEMKKKRAKKLRDIAEKAGREFKISVLNKKYQVLVESFSKNRFSGYTPNYIPVQIFCTKNGVMKIDEKDLVNKIVEVELKNVNKDGVIESDFISPDFF